MQIFLQFDGFFWPKISKFLILSVLKSFKHQNLLLTPSVPVVSSCIMVSCLFLQCSCGRWLASKPDKEKIQMNANDFIIWSWKSNCGQIEGGRGFLMLSTLDLLLRFHFIFQPCCNSRKQAHRFIPDQIDREWLNTGIHFCESQASKVSELMTLCTRCPNKFWTGI